MGLLTESWFEGDLDRRRDAGLAYWANIDRIRARLPASVREFVDAPWHYDISDHRCPHDAWVEHARVHEPSGGKRRHVRRIDIEVRLLGAYHDGYLTLHYSDVTSYRLEHPGGDGEYRGIGHGDWLTDDIALGDDGLVTHEVIFRWGGAWRIECADIVATWEEGAYGPATLEVDPEDDDD